MRSRPLLDLESISWSSYSKGNADARIAARRRNWKAEPVILILVNRWWQVYFPKYFIRPNRAKARGRRNVPETLLARYASCTVLHGDSGPIQNTTKKLLFLWLLLGNNRKKIFITEILQRLQYQRFRSCIVWIHLARVVSRKDRYENVKRKRVKCYVECQIGPRIQKPNKIVSIYKYWEYFVAKIQST